MKESEFLTHIYNSGYLSGHNDTVEGNFTDIYPEDMDTINEDVVIELIEELPYEK